MSNSLRDRTNAAFMADAAWRADMAATQPTDDAACDAAVAAIEAGLAEGAAITRPQFISIYNPAGTGGYDITDSITRSTEVGPNGERYWFSSKRFADRACEAMNAGKPCPSLSQMCETAPAMVPQPCQQPQADAGAHPFYNRTHFPHFVCNNGNWDICANGSGYCASIPTPAAARKGCNATHFGDAAYVRDTLGVTVMVPQPAQQPQACVVRFTVRNDNPATIWNQLARRLGREPTDAEARAEVKRILAEARR